MAPVPDSFHRLAAAADLVIVEGAGSPAEVNLRARDVANMGFARAASVPMVLVGDIDRGGVIAQVIGTQAVLGPTDAAMVKGFIINKFRGDVTLFDEGYRLIAARSGWQGFGVLPYFPEAARLPAEDALDLPRRHGTGALRIVCLGLSRIANFDDLDPLAQEPGVSLTILQPGEALPGDTDLVILPGTKSTCGDLAFLRAQGRDVDLVAHHRRGRAILGLCGGYQTLSRVIRDPGGIEGPPGTVAGLGMPEIETEMTPDKRLERVRARHLASGTDMQGYEIHIGRSSGPGRARPFAMVTGQPEGAVSTDGRVMGSYLRGIFGSDAFRRAFLQDWAAADKLWITGPRSMRCWTGWPGILRRILMFRGCWRWRDRFCFH